MILTKKQIESITKGTVNITEENGTFTFFRFNDGQTEYYKQTNHGFYLKTYATTGVNFDFITDAAEFSFDYVINNASSRNFYFFDIYVDGAMTGHYGENPMWIKKGTINVKLDEGKHRVRVWFPCLAQAKISNVTLTDGATLEPVAAKRKMICWGDSISQGYDAIFPSLAYTNRLADYYEADMVNQAIGGERFVPELLEQDLAFKPDMITVAYGTNDWSGRTREEFFGGCDRFIEHLAEQYKTSEVFIVTPLWRGDKDRITKFGSYYEAVKYIADKAKACGLHVIDGYNLTPHWFEFYSDQRLHPNDLGYGEYTKNLTAEIDKILLK